MGTPQAAVPSLERVLQDGHEVVAVYTQPDRPSGRGNKVTFSPVKGFAMAQGLPVHQPANVKTDDALAQFAAHKADIAVVVAYGRILPAAFLLAYPNGAVNVHFSLLPEYRGAAPVNWAIIKGETETGVTTMKMDAGLDTGPILLQTSTPIGAFETSTELMARLSNMGANLLSETLQRLGSIMPVEQDENRATFAPLLKREDGRIDWRLSAQEIANGIRGFQPFPGSFSFAGDLKLIFWRVRVIGPTQGSDGGRGEILAAGGDRFEISCGHHSVLAVEELQPEGKRRMSVREFLNGSRLSVGDILG